MRRRRSLKTTLPRRPRKRRCDSALCAGAAGRGRARAEVRAGRPGCHESGGRGPGNRRWRPGLFLGCHHRCGLGVPAGPGRRRRRLLSSAEARRCRGPAESPGRADVLTGTRAGRGRRGLRGRQGLRGRGQRAASPPRAAGGASAWSPRLAAVRAQRPRLGAELALQPRLFQGFSGALLSLEVA